MGGAGPHPCNREGGGDGTRPRRNGLMGTSERSERESGASGASERTPLRMYFTNVFLFGRAIKKALKTVYCRFSATLMWFLVAIRTPVLPYWQPALCYQRKVYIHRTECSYQSCEVEAWRLNQSRKLNCDIKQECKQHILFNLIHVI